MAIELKKTLAAHGNEAAIYATPDGRYRVMCFKGRTWSARVGSHAYAKWTATDTQRRGADGFLVTVAVASSLEAVKRRLGRYLEDLEAGCVRAPHDHSPRQPPPRHTAPRSAPRPATPHTTAKAEPPP